MKLTIGLFSVCIGILAVYGQTNPIECEDSKYGINLPSFTLIVCYSKFNANGNKPLSNFS